MSVLVDTSVWSLALRRPARLISKQAVELSRLVDAGDAVMIGPVRQEVLSGVKSPGQFERLRERLRAFPDLELLSADYEEAASSFNTCRSRGIQGSNTDFLICAVAMRRKIAILTTDADFDHYAKVLPIKIHAGSR